MPEASRLTPSIAKKLFSSHLGLTAVVLLATLALARWSFDRGFNDYRNALEEERLGVFAETLRDTYEADGNSWAQLSQTRFNDLQRDSRRSSKDHKPKKKDGSPGKRRRKKTSPTALYDAKDRRVAGRDLDNIDPGDTSRVDIVLNGELIGRLYSTPKRHFLSPPETRFRHQQLVSSLITAAAMLLLAVAISYLLTRLFTRPLARITQSIRKLSSGNYSEKLIDHQSAVRGGDEIHNVMLDLDRLTATLEENRTARRRWLADTAHELRTPLTVLVGDVAALRDGVRPFDASQLDSLERSTARLHRLVEDLHQLAISDVGGLRYQFEATDLRELVEQAVNANRSTPQPRIETEIRGPEKLALHADPHRLAQLLDNLLANAHAYTDAPGRIVITLSRQHDNATVHIDDTAPGVDAGECEKIFDPLYRQELSRERRRAGAGLGLAICRNIVHAHHGSISATPSSLGGLQISVQLPLDLALDADTDRAQL